MFQFILGAFEFVLFISGMLLLDGSWVGIIHRFVGLGLDGCLFCCLVGFAFYLPFVICVLCNLGFWCLVLFSVRLFWFWVGCYCWFMLVLVWAL